MVILRLHGRPVQHSRPAVCLGCVVSRDGEARAERRREALRLQHAREVLLRLQNNTRHGKVCSCGSGSRLKGHIDVTTWAT